MKSLPRTLLLVATFALLAAGCAREQTDATVTPVEITRATASALDGMLLADYPGPKGQVHYAGQSEPEFYCNTRDLLYVHLAPETLRKVRAVFVQDMARADWDEPQGHWIEARSAWFVAGSSRRGSMGPTLASFAARDAAEAFAEQWGGRVLHFDEITPQVVEAPGDGL
jgi:copper chaperone NosL